MYLCALQAQSHPVGAPKPFRHAVLKLAHVMSGHFGSEVTSSLINCHFTWPNLSCEVKFYVKSCSKCQLYNKLVPPKAPLCPSEVILERFEKIAVKIVGPLIQSKR